MSKTITLRANLVENVKFTDMSLIEKVLHHSAPYRVDFFANNGFVTRHFFKSRPLAEECVEKWQGLSLDAEPTISFVNSFVNSIYNQKINR